MSTISINADDFGYSKEVNQGIIEAFNLGYITSTTLMVNMPDATEGINLLPVQYKDKVGLHLNLTEGKPLTKEMSEYKTFCDNDGLFMPTIMPICRKRLLTKNEKRIISNEIKAQIDKFNSFSLPFRHIDSHNHIHNEYQILCLLLPLCKDFQSMRICRNLMPQDSAFQVLKSCYKGWINNKIHKIKNTTAFFGSYADFSRFYKNGSVEIMVHPILYQGEVVDIVNKQQGKYMVMSDYTYQKK